METLKGLDLVENLTTPVPTNVTTFYKNTFANGTDQFGRFTMQDFLGSAIGTKTQNAMENTTSTLSGMNVTALTDIYADMLATVSGTYGPNAGPITIPSGPAAGVYASGDAAFTTGLIPAANTIIASLISTYPTETASLNNNFNAICIQYEYEYANQVRAGLVFADLISGSQQATISFMSSLSTIGQDNQIGGQSPYVMAVADAETQSGQAILGALREGRNSAIMDQANIKRDNVVPSIVNDVVPQSTGVPVAQVVLAPGELPVLSARLLNTDIVTGAGSDTESVSVLGDVAPAQKAGVLYNTFKGKTLKRIAVAEATAIGTQVIQATLPSAQRTERDF